MSNFVRICVSSLARPVVAPGTCRVSSRALQPLATNKALVTWVDRLKRKRSGVQVGACMCAQIPLLDDTCCHVIV